MWARRAAPVTRAWHTPTAFTRSPRLFKMPALTAGSALARFSGTSEASDCSAISWSTAACHDSGPSSAFLTRLALSLGP